jgi:alpha-glucuronidase
MFRAFVYDNHITYANWTSDRANAQLEFFQHLDGQFDENVVIQIKYGPIDFQVREAPSPLFAALHNTSTAIELQVTPEYLGQNCHFVYLAPLWKEILDFDLRAENKSTKIKDVITGERFKRPDMQAYQVLEQTPLGLVAIWLCLTCTPMANWLGTLHLAQRISCKTGLD